MNLAKIRQKARNNRISESAPVPAAPPLTASPGDAVNGEQHVSSETMSMADAFDHPLSIPEYRDEATAAAEPARIRRDLDPVQAILAGREAAGCDEEGRAASVVPLPDAEESYAEYLSVRISDELYGVDIMRIKEIIKPKAVTEVPRAPGYLPGVISLRGVIIPVIDMLGRLGFSSEPDTFNSRVVVVRSGTGFTGLMVDEVIQVVRIPREGIEPVPIVLEGIDRDFVSGIGRTGGKMIILLNLDSVTGINLC